MIFYIDTEFDGFGGDLLTLALVSEDLSVPQLYLARDDIDPSQLEPWVKDNVYPIIDIPAARPSMAPIEEFGKLITAYLKASSIKDGEIIIVADWPDDLRYLMMTLITGPGMMVNLKQLDMCLRRCEPWPTKLLGQTQHNALCDARALRALFV